MNLTWITIVLRLVVSRTLFNLLAWLSLNEEPASNTSVEECVWKVGAQKLKQDLEYRGNSAYGFKHVEYFRCVPLTWGFEKVKLKNYFVHYFTLDCVLTIVIIEHFLSLLAFGVLYLVKRLTFTLIFLNFVFGEYSPDVTYIIFSKVFHIIVKVPLKADLWKFQLKICRRVFVIVFSFVLVITNVLVWRFNLLV